MAIFLDSAIIHEVREAAGLGFVKGVTTNPTLILKSGSQDYVGAVAEICNTIPGKVFYQINAPTLSEMRQEYDQVKDISPNLAYKIPCTLTGLQFTAELSRKAEVGITAIFTPAQAYLSAEAGARYVLPFVNRTTRLTGSGFELVNSIVEVIAHTQCEVLAVSLKSALEVTDVVRAGAQHISIPLNLIKEMAENSLTQSAISDFNQSLSQLKG
ncbi:MAG: transaldolase [Chloroflexi bacterium]|jgi:transaldolase|nr:transaldolase family protein [Anaerolineaceae bacterium]NMB88172.1 transaldolase [Chloroflexota bacterium]